MTDDIRAVKEETNQVFDDVLKSRSSQIGDFVLVTFNDPDTPRIRAKTINREVFKSALADIIVDGGGDCPELSMGGILKALEESAPNSELYIFTDATAKDYERYEEVKTMSQRKSSQVTFLLTGICTSKSDKRYLVYHDLAEVTGGEVFHIDKQNINKIIKYIIEKSKSARTMLVKKKVNGNDQFQFNVDSNVNNVIVSAAGGFTEMSIFNSDGNEMLTELVVDEDLVHIVRFSAKPGLYTVKVKTNEKTSVKVWASTNISFEHGFSQSRPTSISETSTRPIMGQKSYLSILLTDTAKDVELVESQLWDVKDNVVMTIPIKRISFRGDQQFYLSEPVNIPKDMFKVAIIGYTSRKERIVRVGAVFVEPQSIRPNFIDFEHKPPKASVTTVQVKVESNMPFSLKCKVEAYPKPYIIWENEFGNKYSPEVKILDFPYDYISILEVEKAAKNETYYCKAQNRFGKDQKQVNVILSPAVPKIDKKDYFFIQRKGVRTDIPCKLLQGFPNPKVTWQYRKNPDFTYEPLKGVNETLTLNDTQPYHSGSYRCVVQNDLGKDSHEIELMVSYPPVIDNKFEEKVAAESKLIDIPCQVEGMPFPTIKWLKNNQEIKSDSKYHIFRDNTLRFQVTLSDIGNYSCIANNELGTAERVVQLNVYKPVSINKPKNSTINIMTGSLLRLTCDADGYPKPDLKWTYLSFDPKSLPKVMKLRKKTNELEFVRRVEDSDSGFYICDASSSGSEAYITYTIFVQVPPMIYKGNTKFNAIKGDLALRIPCKNKGNPKPTVNWKKDGLDLVASSDSQYIEEDGTLVLVKPFVEDSGQYTCIAENEFGRDEKLYEITIDLYPRPVDPITTTVIREEEMTNIKCDIPHQPTDYLRWYKDGEEFYSGELRLDNPQPESDGIYTCRVSNYNSSRNYHTRVKVHFKPRFINDQSNEPIEFVEGFSATLDCGAVGDPTPSIIWTLNGNKIDVRSLTYRIEYMSNNDIGKYECHVFNDFGYINRTFQIKVTACLIPLEYFNNKQPLMITPSLTWATYKIIKGNRNENFVSVPAEGSFVLYCPGNFFTNPVLNRRKTIKAKCIRDSILEVYGKAIDFLDLKCYMGIKPFIKSTKRKCGTGVNTELIIVGYILGRGFLKVYEVCIDKDNMIPLYTRHDLDEFMSNSVPKEEPKYLEAKEFPIDFDQMYSQQANTLLGRFLKTNDSCQFSKRQLVSPRDVHPGSQIATYSYLNVVPHWSCYNQNWERIENTIRSLAQQLKLTVWTGTSEVTSSPAPYGIEIYFRDSSHKELVAPLYLWKVVQNFELAGSVAIIQVNVPHITPSEVQKYVKCRDICNEIDWLRSDDWHDVRKGYTYCCSINEFENAFHYTGVFSGPKNLLKVPILDFISNQLP